MKTESTIEPNEIYIDKIKGGRARLLCRWNLETVTRIDQMTEEEQTIYKYDETALWWTFPKEYTSTDGVTVTINTKSKLRAYINQNKAEVLNFAKATKINEEDLE